MTAVQLGSQRTKRLVVAGFLVLQTAVVGAGVLLDWPALRLSIAIVAVVYFGAVGVIWMGLPDQPGHS